MASVVVGAGLLGFVETEDDDVLVAAASLSLGLAATAVDVFRAPKKDVKEDC